VQGRSNLRALREVLPELATVRAFDTNPDALRAYVAEMAAETGLDVLTADSAESAVRGADVIVTAGPILKDSRPVIERSWLAEGVFAAPLDFDSYFTFAALEACDLFCTDDTEQLRYYKAQERIGPTPPIHGDLGEIVAGIKPGRTQASQRIMTMNLGLALEDVATAAKLIERAKAAGIGTTLPL